MSGTRARTRAGALMLLAAIALAPAGRAPGYGPGYSVAKAGNRVAARPAVPAPRIQDGAGFAKAINAAMPLAVGALTSARPFYLDASPEDRAKAIDCLAAADYYEAGNGAPDQRAVAQVVLNRVRHTAFPATICGVVFAGADRRTGCQFTFACDGSLGRRRPSANDWQKARETAAEMLLGRVESAVGQATHYHTDWVSPPWDRTMDKLAVVETHLFFRWRGAAGASSAFVQRYSGAEPRIAGLAGLSAAHEAAVYKTDPAPMAPAAPSVSPEGLFLVVVPVDLPGAYRSLAEERCAGLTECRFIAWTDPMRRGQAMPLSGRAVDAISFTFVRRPGMPDHALWNCAEFTRIQHENCLLRGT